MPFSECSGHFLLFGVIFAKSCTALYRQLCGAFHELLTPVGLFLLLQSIDRVRRLYLGESRFCRSYGSLCYVKIDRIRFFLIPIESIFVQQKVNAFFKNEFSIENGKNFLLFKISSESTWQKNWTIKISAYISVLNRGLSIHGSSFLFRRLLADGGAAVYNSYGRISVHY